MLEDISEYSKAIFFFLDNELEPQIIATVLRSWVLFTDGQLKVAFQHGEFQLTILTLHQGLKEGLSGKEARCCGTNYRNVLSHVKRKHGIAISSTMG